MRGRPVGSKAEKPRELTKRQRWTSNEWQQVESAAQKAAQTPSEFVRSATLAKVQEIR